MSGEYVPTTEDVSRGCLCYGADDVTDPKCPYCRETDTLLLAISQHHSGDVHEGRRIRDDIMRSPWLATHNATIRAEARAEGISIGHRDGMKDGAAQTRAEIAREIRDAVPPVAGWRSALLYAARIAEGTP